MSQRSLPTVLVADPPWRFGDRLPGPKRGAEKHYRTLSVTEVMRFPLPEMAPDAALFLWRVSSMQAEALDVVRAWGFKLKTEIVWVKTKLNGQGLAMGMGRITRGAHETCLVATRGRPLVLSHSERSVIMAPRLAHSTKPPAFYHLVERLYAGPFVELFARRHRDGWTCLGNEVEPAQDGAAA